MIRFIHTADIHFGMENYGRVDPVTGIHSRLLDFEKVLNICIDAALEKQVDFFLFCGDAYKTAHPSPTQQRLLLGCLLRLYRAGIPIVIIVGNHDHPLSYGKANALDIFGQLPVDGFHVMAKPGILRLETKHGPVNIVGIPWPTRNTIAVSKQYSASSAADLTEHISQSVGILIENYAKQLDPDTPAVLASHITVSSGIFSGSEKRAIYGNDPVLLPSQLGIKPFDYVALGHLHRYQNLNPVGYPPIVYSGSLERIDFGERKEEKGFCLVSLEKKGRTTYEFVKVPTRPFIQIEVTLVADADQTKTIVDQVKKYKLDDAIVKLLYFVPLHTKDTVDIRKVEAALADAYYCVGIIPVVAQEVRAARAVVDIDMSLQTLLGCYIDGKKELAERKDILVQKALALTQEIEAEEL